MSEQATAYLEQLVTNELSYKISSIILTSLMLLGLLAFYLYARYQDKKTAKIREEWFATLTEEQRKAVREQKKMKL